MVRPTPALTRAGKLKTPRDRLISTTAKRRKSTIKRLAKRGASPRRAKTLSGRILGKRKGTIARGLAKPVSTRRLIRKTRKPREKARKSPFMWVKCRQVNGSKTDTMAVRLDVGKGTFTTQLRKAKEAFGSVEFFGELDEQKFYKGQPDAVRYYDAAGNNLHLDNWRAREAQKKRGLYASG